MNNMRPPIERHPWPPYIPDGARYLFLGTFPPKPIRWSMEFFYPNKTNDFWKIMGLLFMNDREALWDSASGRYDLAAIKSLLDHEGIALWDTAMAVRRLKDNASDKFLEIVEPIDLSALLDTHPTISQIITTGEKATGGTSQCRGASHRAASRLQSWHSRHHVVAHALDIAGLSVGT